jgi:hypothetical protein
MHSPFAFQISFFPIQSTGKPILLAWLLVPRATMRPPFYGTLEIQRTFPNHAPVINGVALAPSCEGRSYRFA